MNAKVKLTVLNFMEFAVWGAYLTSMGTYLARVGMAGQIGWFYSVQGFVSLFMPALMGIVADRWMEAQRLLSLSHLLAGIFMLAASVYGYQTGDAVQFAPLFTLYTLSVAFFMPTIALSNSVAYSALDQAEGFPAHPCVWHRGFHHQHVDCRSRRNAIYTSAVRLEWIVEHRHGCLCHHYAPLPREHWLAQESV